MAFNQNLIGNIGGSTGYPNRFPGVNQNHPAAEGLRGSFVAQSGNFVDLINYKSGTITGSPTSGIDSIIGPRVAYAASTANIKFTGQSTVNDTSQILAAIVVPTSVAAVTKTIISTSGTGSQGYHLQVATANVQATAGATTILGGITLSINTPYFIAASIISGASKFIAINLSNGSIKTNSASTSYTAVAPDGTYIIGNAPTAANANMHIAAVMNSSGYLGAAQLLQWANNPWSFWYPDDDVFQLKTPPQVQSPLNQQQYLELTPREFKEYRSYEDWFPLELIGQDKLPNRQQDWPNPYPVQWYRDWFVNLLQTTLKPAFQAPFYQTDWPLPQPITWYRSQESSYNLNLIGKDILPFRTDVSVQYPLTWYRDWYNNLLETTLKSVVAQLPFNQYDWANPTVIPPLLQYILQNLTLNLPIPAVQVTTGGRQVSWEEIQNIERLSKAFLKDHNAPIPKFRTPESQAASRLGRMGGIASGKARNK